MCSGHLNMIKLAAFTRKLVAFFVVFSGQNVRELLIFIQYRWRFDAVYSLNNLDLKCKKTFFFLPN